MNGCLSSSDRAAWVRHTGNVGKTLSPAKSTRNAHKQTAKEDNRAMLLEKKKMSHEITQPFEFISYAQFILNRHNLT